MLEMLRGVGVLMMLWCKRHGARSHGSFSGFSERHGVVSDNFIISFFFSFFDENAIEWVWCFYEFWNHLS